MAIAKTDRQLNYSAATQRLLIYCATVQHNAATNTVVCRFCIILCNNNIITKIVHVTGHVARLDRIPLSLYRRYPKGRFFLNSVVATNIMAWPSLVPSSPSGWSAEAWPQ